MDHRRNVAERSKQKAIVRRMIDAQMTFSTTGALPSTAAIRGPTARVSPRPRRYYRAEVLSGFYLLQQLRTRIGYPHIRKRGETK
jgi:hypothetical protein